MAYIRQNRNPELVNMMRKKPCYFNRVGRCFKGSRCTYEHSEINVEPCRAYNFGACSRGNRCPFGHIANKDSNSTSPTDDYFNNGTMNYAFPPKERRLSRRSYNSGSDTVFLASSRFSGNPLNFITEEKYGDELISHETVLPKKFQSQHHVDRDWILDRNINSRFGTPLQLICPRNPEHRILISNLRELEIYAKFAFCDSSCKRILNCGHGCSVPCHDSQTPCPQTCIEPCSNILDCGHRCKGRCGKVCPPCEVPREVYFACGHISTEVPCHLIEEDTKIFKKGRQIKSKNTCTRICDKFFKLCGHQCRKPCHGKEDCGNCPQGCSKPFHPHFNSINSSQNCQKQYTPCVNQYDSELNHQEYIVNIQNSYNYQLNVLQKELKNLKSSLEHSRRNTIIDGPDSFIQRYAIRDELHVRIEAFCNKIKTEELFNNIQHNGHLRIECDLLDLSSRLLFYKDIFVIASSPNTAREIREQLKQGGLEVLSDALSKCDEVIRFCQERHLSQLEDSVILIRLDFEFFLLGYMNLDDGMTDMLLF